RSRSSRCRRRPYPSSSTTINGRSARPRPRPCWCNDNAQGPPMNEASEFRDLLPALPEIVLAVGAMVLLMLGASRGERSAGAMNWLAILLLIGAGAVVVWLPAGKLVTFGGSFIVDPFARFLKLLALTGSATAILMSTNYLKVERQERFEYPILI